MGDAAVRASLREQAHWGDELESPLTALLCRLLAERLDRSTDIGRRVLDWPGDPSPEVDNVGARLCAGIQYMARSGAAPTLLALYPPAPLPDADTLWHEVRPLLDGGALDPWLDSPPQTNEVARAASLYAALLVATARFPLPIRLFELGSSAGLNLILDRYRYDLGGLVTGILGSPLLLAPEWTGAPPPNANVQIVSRAGVDLRPSRDGDKLLAYVWAGHTARRERLQTALTIAALDPPPVEQGEAASWLERMLPAAEAAGCLRVVMHSVAFQYFPADSQRRITRLIEALGAEAGERSPLAWLRYEQRPGEAMHSVRLLLWPNGEDLHLGWAHAHGASVDWLIGSGPARR